MNVTLAYINRTFQTTLLASVILCLTCPLQAAPNITITTSTTISATDDYATVNVYDTPPAHTTVDLNDASIDHLFAYDSAIINSMNSTTNAFFVMDHQSTANITASTIDTLLASSNATINITSGVIDYIQADTNASITIENVENDYGLVMRDDTSLTVNGGQIASISAEGNTTININGGEITGLQLGQLPEHQPTIIITAGNFNFYSAIGNGTLNIYGYELNFTPNAGIYNNGQLTGFWHNDSPFTIDYYNSYNEELDAGPGFQIAADNVVLHLPGDASGDSSVTLLDLDILGHNYGITENATLSQGDFNGDGAVSLVDLDILGRFYGGDAIITPEPSAATLLLAASLVVLKRRNYSNSKSYQFIHNHSPLTKPGNHHDSSA